VKMWLLTATHGCPEARQRAAVWMKRIGEWEPTDARSG
jgi:hypothetical protein